MKVLKLHGSLGWYASPERHDGRGILIDGWVFLKKLGFACDNEPIHVLNRDPDSDYHWLLQRYWDWPLMVYPTFLKSVSGGEFADLWSQASDALSRADQVDIYGYSLPASDGAARVLFNQVRRRIRSREAAVHVHDPSYGAQKTWRAFLGKGAKISGDRLA